LVQFPAARVESEDPFIAAFLRGGQGVMNATARIEFGNRCANPVNAVFLVRFAPHSIKGMKAIHALREKAGRQGILDARLIEI
jgi:hypothetical protein